MKERRWRFRLSTILLLIVIVALGLALVRQQQSAATREQELQELRQKLMSLADRNWTTEKLLEHETQQREFYSEVYGKLVSKSNQAQRSPDAEE